MSVFDTTRGSVGNRTGFVSRMVEAALAWNDARVTRNALAKLTERELNDIGLTRFDADNMGR